MTGGWRMVGPRKHGRSMRSSPFGAAGSLTEALVLLPTGLVVIETDGTYEQVDTPKAPGGQQLWWLSVRPSVLGRHRLHQSIRILPRLSRVPCGSRNLARGWHLARLLGPGVHRVASAFTTA